MSLAVNNKDDGTDLKLIRCAIQDEELIEALDNFTYDKNYNEKMLVELSLSKLLEEEGYL